MLRRFAVEPGLVGLDWTGFRDPEAPVRRFHVDGHLGASTRLPSPDDSYWSPERMGDAGPAPMPPR
ncbi:hypothetical protein CA850_27260 [Micromonospora echinospora]|uniref:Uncharacterized protein n=2 Tax=Micromonospora echinospora TaxID=1877 RepID=A0A1C4WKJ9_MICEC|nr:hypothetical protein [Micromonospora echinospora]OZV76402.1 hypothetical protein CA850_27260 [Micromonospora echinospora]SCE96732.1 hypothetical protein GA0070618_2280 [Micromonospora echinospora]